MINMLAQVLKEDSRVHSLYEEHCGQDEQLSPVNCSGSRKWFKDSEMELIRGSAKIEELASWLEERKHVLHEVIVLIVDDEISFSTTDGPQSSSRTTWRMEDLRDILLTVHVEWGIPNDRDFVLQSFQEAGRICCRCRFS